MKKILLSSLFWGLTLFSGAVFAQESFSEWVAKGNKSLTVEDYTEALQCFKNALDSENKVDEQVAEVAKMAAVCANRLGKNDEVLGFRRLAIRQKTDDELLYEEQIELAFQLKNIPAMEEALLIGREMVPRRFTSYTQRLAYLYYNEHDYEKTIRLADEYLAEKPGSKQLIGLQASAYRNLGNYPKAIEGFKFVVDANPDDPRANSRLGLTYYLQGTDVYNDAKKWYNSLSKPSRMDYAEYRKKIQQSFQPYEAALPYLLKAYSLKETDKQVKKTLYNIYNRMENTAEAKKYE